MNVARTVDAAAALFPERTAIVFEDQSLSYGELADSCNRVASALRGNGIKRHDRVAILLGNSPSFVISYLAVLKAGAVAVSINPTLTQDEIAFIVSDSGSNLIITSAESIAKVAGEVSLWLVDGADTRAKGLSELADAASPTFVTEQMEPDDVASLLYTSGTTGSPKGAALTHANIISNAWSTVHHAGYRPTDRIILFLPLFHVFGQNFILNATLRAGATLILHRRFVPDQILDSVRRNSVSVFLAVPSVYIAILNSGLDTAALEAVRYDFSAAATMPVDVADQWKGRFGRPIFEGYGLTECSPFACYNHDYRHVPGSVGSAVENFELRIVDEHDLTVPYGELGEIVIRGPGVMKGYWNQTEATSVALRGGWLHSGDIGRMDEGGYVFIVDRLKDMVNVAGFKVWPAEVENVIYKHPSVKEAAVYATPDPVRGEAVAAAIVLKQGAQLRLEELVAFCNTHLAKYKVPESISFVGELPKNATGKVLKRVLRDQSK